MSKNNMKNAFFCLTFLYSVALSGDAMAIDVKAIESTFRSEKCADPKANSLELGRKLITPQTLSKKTANAWLKKELKTGAEVPELNWIRALNPWILPEDFTSRTAFIECAAHLRTYSDAKARTGNTAAAGLATESLEKWKTCVEVLYPNKLPAEFTLLQGCLK